MEECDDEEEEEEAGVEGIAIERFLKGEEGVREDVVEEPRVGCTRNPLYMDDWECGE